MYYEKLRPSQPTIFVGRTPRPAADPLVGLLEAREKPDQGVRRGRGRPPHMVKKH